VDHKQFLSDRLNALTESATLEMTRRSRELKEQGIDVINLSIGEPDFNTPDSVKEAAKQYAGTRHHGVAQSHCP